MTSPATSYEQLTVSIFADLKGVGIQAAGFAELRRTKQYHKGVPILLHWLRQADNRDVKEDIVRSLSMPWVDRAVGRSFVEEFEKSDDLLLKWAIGNGLSIVADESLANDLIRIARDRNHARAREMVVVALSRLKDPTAPSIANELLDDPEVEGHAVIALGRLKSTEYRNRIAERLNHSKSWIRAEAKKALITLEAAAK